MASTGTSMSSLEDCVDWCTGMRCQYISYNTKTQLCIGYASRGGVDEVEDDDTTSLNMHCLGKQDVRF